MSFSYSRDRMAELRDDMQPPNNDNRSNKYMERNQEFEGTYNNNPNPNRYYPPPNRQQQQQQQNQYQYNNNNTYEMESRSSSYPPPPSSYGGGGGGRERAIHIDISGMSGFFEEIEHLKTEINIISNNIHEIQSIHENALVSTNEMQSKDFSYRLTNLKKETTQRNNDIKNRIKNLEQFNSTCTNNSDVQIRRTQTTAIRNKFLETIQQYQDMERTYDKKYRQRVERQIRIVKPNATHEEIEEMIDSDQSNQVFTQSLMQAGRTSQAKAVLSEVQERHQDIKRIEKTILELHQLFLDMSMLIENQGQTINQINEHTEDTAQQLEQGNTFISKAIISARATRAKKWCCFAITIIICVVIAILVWYFGFGHPGVQ